MRKILVIEDNVELRIGYRDMFADSGIKAILAGTLLEAIALFERNPDISAVFIDGLFPRDVGGSPLPEAGRKCNGVKFILNVDADCPMIACSDVNVVNRQMRDAGATETCEKGTAILRRARELFKLP